MNPAINIGSLFLEGLLSFFSPCVLPLLPLYFGYLSKDAVTVDEQGNKKYSRIKVLVMTIFFVLGICTVFVLLSLGTSAFRSFFTDNTLIIQIIGGVLLILFGLVSLHVIEIPFLQKEHRSSFRTSGKMTWLNAYLMGFFFSFAWSPCIGPMLASALVVSAGASSQLLGFVYIGAYALGFVIMFLIAGLFTEELLNLFQKKRNIIRYTEVIGGIIIIVMGGYMLFQAGSDIASRSSTSAAAVPTSEPTAAPSAAAEATAEAETDTRPDIEKYGFTLNDRNGTAVNLSDYKGKKIVLNFFGTWCPYCKEELPYLQEINDTRDDVQVVLIATPNSGSEGSIEDINAFMDDNGYTMQVLFDTDLSVTYSYGVSGYPTTCIFQTDGDVYGCAPGYVQEDQMNEYLDAAQ